VGSIPAGNVLLSFARLRLFSSVRELGLRLIRSLPLAHPYGLRLCRTTPVGSIPARNGLLNFARLRLFSNVRELGLRLIRSLPLAHPYRLRLCRSTPVGSIPAGNGLSNFARARLWRTCVSVHFDRFARSPFRLSSMSHDSRLLHSRRKRWNTRFFFRSCTEVITSRE